jgi:asparagine synthetase B (glutamine-hydrolysing)
MSRAESPAQTVADAGSDWLVSLRTGRGSTLRVLKPGSPPPVIAKDDLRTVVFDGTLHNAEALRALASDERGPLVDDAGVILAAYVRLGTKVLERIKGIFALVLFDAETDTLVAARDPLGVYPLFYAERRRELLLSTSADVLARSPDVSREINRPVLAGHIAELWPTPEETAFTGVKRLPSGHALQLRGGVRRVYRHWDPEELPGESPARRADEALERFEVVLRQAVDRSLSYGAAAVSLSGGIDSATVAVAAAEVSRARGMPAPWALSFVVSHPTADESETQARIAAGLGMPRLSIGFEEAAGQGEILLSALRRSATAPMPLLNMLAGAQDSLVLEALRRNRRVLLSGDGGDEWLGPLPSYAADRLLALDIRSLRRLSQAYQWYSPASRLALYRGMLWRAGFRPLLRAAAAGVATRSSPGRAEAFRRRRFHELLPRWLAPDPTVRRELVDRLASRPSALDPRTLYTREKRAMLERPERELNMEDAFATFRRRGVRILAPLLDADLVALLYNTPSTLLNQGDRVKWMARALLDSRLPSLRDAWERKVYADPYLDSLLRREGEEVWRATGEVGILSELGLVDAALLDVAAERAFAGGEGDWYQIFAAMSSEWWLRPRVA